MKQEVELKFEFVANKQFKYIPSESTEVIFKKLKGLCDIINIRMADYKQENIVDEYYDDSISTLEKHCCALRHREHDGKHHITLKAGKKLQYNGSLERFEIEVPCNPSKMKQFIKSPGELTELFKQHLSVDISVDQLIRILTVYNQRTSTKLFTPDAEYLLCHDRYYYYNTNGGYSDTNSEIEIETIGKHKDDPQIQKLRQAIIELLNYLPNQKSKLEKGIEWTLCPDYPEYIVTVYSVALDIIKYSIKPANIQKRIIKILNHHTKEAICDIRRINNVHDVIYLPTGDGMIIAFEDRPELILPTVINIQQRIKEHNRQCPLHEQFEFRCGLHTGPVFKYSDVNENLNFAGNGINVVQRVMSLGDEWHVLASKEAYEAMGNIELNLQRYFKKAGPYKAKHGVEIEIWNVFDKDRQIGNPATPLLV